MVKTLDEGSNRQYIDIANEPLIPDDLDIENTTANNNNNAYNDVIDLESSEAYNTSSKNKLQSIFDVKTKKPNSETSAMNNNTVLFNSNSKRADFNPLKRPYNQVSNDVSGYSPTSQHGTQQLRSALKKPRISAEPFLGLNWMSTEEFLEDSVDAQPHTNGQQNVIIHPSARLVVPISLTEAMNNPGGPNFVYEQQVYLRNKAQQQNQMQMRGRRQGQGQGRGQGEFFKDNQTVPAGKRVSFLGLLPDTSIQKDSANVAAVSNGSVNKNVLFANSKKPASLVLPKRKSDPINNISTSTNNGSLYQNENKDIVVQKNNDATLASNIVNTNNLPAPAPSISTSISTPNPTPTPKPLPKKVEYIKLQVEIEEGKKQIFKYYENQDLNQTVLQFCQNFNLPNLVDGLKKLVKQKLAAKKRAKMNSLP
ncbi:hypothetical protein AX774_g7363 [Zancudomyces culisetae]|uniref:Uncharacterized protein n=1 Tax=Zancudomyces culisetae TaxID=1213189 RepID=A0A1R1PEA1_ZANCU|nr:hypothetical protein AX774_g7363 [Zancudomyces culisetae]|eukprot:OMH79233.1 hypothetical protein AX774_g7363 [Zancudomyces culisetae]